jgi:peptide/nickel transport system permease protein
VSQDPRLTQRLEGVPPEVALFARRGTLPDPEILNGRYQLEVEGLLFEEASNLDARLVVYGKAYGLAGTDHRRRDLAIALLWGTPIALSFGLLAAVATSFASLIIAATGVWLGGWVDATIQRITEVNAILPSLPILILVTTFYSRSLWVILAVVVLLSIFSLGIKFFRAFFLQVREAPYVEAARAYGAGSGRIILHYMLPRVLPVLIPGFVTAIPSFVFLETSLAFLGLGDPNLPTWGKVLNDAYQNGALYKGHYYWVLQPAVLLMLTGLSFAMVGFALDRIFNPRLRVQ